MNGEREVGEIEKIDEERGKRKIKERERKR